MTFQAFLMSIVNGIGIGIGLGIVYVVAKHFGV